MIYLETERLILKEMLEDDAAGMFELNNDPEVIKYTGDHPFLNTDEVIQLIRSYDQYKKYKTGRLNIFLKSTGEYIGWCGLKYDADSKETDIGYRFHKRYWAQGYATEAAIACFNYGFNTLHLNKIIGRAMKQNTASIKVFEKLGMQYKHDSDCATHPAVVYSITKEEWK